MSDKVTEYFNGSFLPSDVWKEKYQLTTIDGEPKEETPEDMHKRMAEHFGRIEESYRSERTSVLKNKPELLSEYGRSRDELYEDKVFELFDEFEYIVPQGSIMSMLGNPYQVGSLSNCLAGETKVLTRRGFTPIKKLSGKTVEILTKGGKWKEAPFHSFGEQKLYKIELERGKDNSKTIYATKDHRWFESLSKRYSYKSREKTTVELQEGDKLKLQFGKGRKSFGVSPFGVAHGIAYGDGSGSSTNNNATSITLCEDSRQFGDYFIDPPVSSDEDLCKGGSDYYGSLPNYFQELPDLNENQSYLYGWLAGYVAADGTVHESGTVVLSSSVRENLEFAQDVCGVLGLGSGDIKKSIRDSALYEEEIEREVYNLTIYPQHLTEEFFIKDSHREYYNEDMKSVFRWEVVSVNETNKVEEVYCATVPETESFVIEGNILSGNCVVVPDVKDSYGGIMYSDQQLAQLFKRRAGVGVDVSQLRPEGAGVSNAARTSTGAVSFMHRFSNTTNEVAQDGRRGALMLTMDCRHPDMTRFVEEKDDPTTMTGANISAKWTDDFLEAVENNENYTLRFPVDVDPEQAEITREVNAQELFKTASENAHVHGGDPGCMYIDRMEDYSTDCGYPNIRVSSTNPCGEIGMWGGPDSCRLIAMNLMSVVENPFTDEANIDFDLLYKISYEQQRLLDNLVDLEVEAIDRIIEKVKNDPEHEKYKRIEIETWEDLKESGEKYRRTGAGFTALGDMLAAVGVEYGSEECDEVLHKVMSTKLEGEWDASTDLAIERGTFPEWDSQYDDTEFFDMLEEEFPDIYERNMEFGRRNISLSTVAPTGSVSLMSKIQGDFGTTSGIEPLFSTEENKAWHTRNKRADGSEDYDYVDEEGNKWKQYPVFHNGFRIWMEENGYENPTEKPEEELKEIFKESPYVTSAGLHWKDRLRTQGITQKYISHSISSTLNLPEDADIEETYKIYKNGRKYGLKGATIFRNGSKRGVLEGEDGGSSDENEISYHDAPERPEVLEADIHQVRYNGEPWKILVGRLEGKPYEVFAIKTGKDTGIRVRFTDSEDNKIEEGLIRKTDSGVYNFEAKDGKVVIEDIAEYAPDDNVRVDTRLLSLNLRHGVKPEYLVSQLEKADGSVVSFGRAILKALRSYLDVDPDDKCPECGEESLAFIESCVKCRNCSYSKC